MKKLFLLPLALLLVACGPSQDPSTPSVSTPSEEPSVSDPSTEPSVETNYIDYQITVEYEDGTPFAGARVQACTADGSQCFMPVTADENGLAVLTLTDAEYEVHVLNVPEGYHYDEDGYKISGAVTAVTIVLFQEQVARHG